MRDRIRSFFSQCFDTLRLCPAEAVLSLFFFVYFALVVEEVAGVDDRDGYRWLFPLFFCASMLLNRWTARGGKVRWIYYASPLLAVPFLWVDVQDWTSSVAYAVALVLCVLMVGVCRWRRGNGDFVGDGLHYLKNFFFAELLTGAAWALSAAIYFSLRYIFPGLPWGDEEKVAEYVAMVAFVLLLPLVFLTLVRLQDDEFKPVKFVDMMITWVVSPAILIYTAILYIYFLKIVLLWSLPQGGVAWMVFAFAILAVLAKAYQPMMGGRRLYDWFYDRFQWISLPALAMFWVGVAHRIGEYGLTQERVYLLVCGLIMTLVALMFFSGRWGRYVYAATVAIVLLAAFTYVPGITAKELGIRSQRARLEKTLDKLDLIGENGKMKRWKQPEADSLRAQDFVQLYEAFSYLSRQNDKAYLKQLCGITDNAELSRDVMPHNVQYGYYHNMASVVPDNSFNVRFGKTPVEVAGFRYLHPTGSRMGAYDWRYANDADSLRVYRTDGECVFRESHQQILSAQLARTGLSKDSLYADQIEEHAGEFQVYDHGGYRIVFDRITLLRDGGQTRLTDLSVGYVLSNE